MNTVPAQADNPIDEARAARLARIYAAVAEAAPWYAGGLPPDLLCPA